MNLHLALRMILIILLARHDGIVIGTGTACADCRIDQVGIALSRDLFIGLLNLKGRDLRGRRIFLRLVDHFVEFFLCEVDLLTQRLSLDRDRHIEQMDSQRLGAIL